MKGLLTACWLMTIALGNVIIAVVSIANLKAKAIQYFVMSGIMGVVFLVFLWIAKGYQYVQTEEKKEASIN